MKLLDRLLGRSATEDQPEAVGIEEASAPADPSTGPADGAPSVQLDPLLDELSGLLDTLPADLPDPDVVRARLADTCRDADLAPLDPSAFDALAGVLDEGGWRRLWLLVAAASHEALGSALPAIAAAKGADEVVRDGFVGVAAGTGLLTIDLLRQSRLRLEELARRWILALGAGVEGESVEESLAALARLDYARLLAQVDRAKLSAEERVAYLKKLQEAQEARLPRRGKW